MARQLANEYESTVDTRLAELSGEADTILNKLRAARTSLAYASGAPMGYVRKQRVCTLNTDELIAHAWTVLNDDTLSGRFYIGGTWTSKDDISEALGRVRDLLIELQAKNAEVKAQNELYTGWARFFLVTSSAGGHIHSSMQCSTCRFDTGFAWLPTLSGLTEKDAVDEHGAILCTVCFPTAPVEWTNAHELAAEAKKAEKCPGSGTIATDFRRRYCACPHCDAVPAITSNGYLRAHKPVKS